MRLGNLDLFVITENEVYSNQVTSKPVENGSDITDHRYFNPLTLDLTINVSSNALEIKKQLEELRNSSTVLTYEGLLETFENMIVVNLAITKGDILNGFTGTLTIQQIEITEQSQITTINLGVDPFTGLQVQSDNDNIEKRQLETDDTVDIGLFDGIEGVL